MIIKELNEISMIILSRERMENNISQIIALDKLIKSEPWDAENFLMDLPGKWHYSLLAIHDNDIVGILIVSIKDYQSIHIHRFIVEQSYQGQGVGTFMLRKLAVSIAEDGFFYLTLKTSWDNIHAQEIYTHLGFEIEDSSSTGNITYKILIDNLIKQ